MITYTVEDTKVLVEMLREEGRPFIAKRIEGANGLKQIFRSDLQKIIFEIPFKSLPLHLNDVNGISCFVRWRLRIGK